MSDIIKRLRKENSMPPHYGAPKIQDDAADEIERLREQIDAAKEAIDTDDVIAAYHILDQALSQKESTP